MTETGNTIGYNFLVFVVMKSPEKVLKFAAVKICVGKWSLR